jgi:hypothetical protein
MKQTTAIDAEEKKTAALTEMVFILDRSGSMHGLEEDTIGGFNSMIDKQKKEDGTAFVSTVLFCDESRVIHDRVEIGRIESLEAADIISIQETFATYENVERIHDVGKRVFVWTVNEEETMKNLVSLNVDAILTNDPELCKSVLNEYSSDMMNMLQRIHSAFEFL